ncbi:MAG: cob(I)yrinic acid a,c-diamide adenosyltransferase [Planctomycetaceae bacterium]|nr:cob(I)yrinic acid a,c-diamide adenosyltransferase [Planctomycetaceae bacterium]
MVHLNRIYTRSGDAGETSLGDGARVLKTHPRIVAMGAVDEVNAALGVVRAGDPLPADFDELLARVQNDLFDMGADLCVPISPQNEGRNPLRLTAEDVERLERAIDRFNADLPPLTSFILPGGTKAAALLHVARAQCRRAEIDILRLMDAEEGNRCVAVYLNRLSDLLFVLARAANQRAARSDVLWQPGANRSE